MRPRLFVTREVDDEVMHSLRELSEVSYWHGEGRCPRELMERSVADVDVALGTDRWDADLMDRAGRLRLIANVGVGYDNIDVSAANRRGILVTNTPDVLSDTTADLAFALLMAVARRIGEVERFVRAGRWKTPGVSGRFLGRDIHHATLGVVGLGRIGSRVAHRGLGFHMRVLYHDSVRREDLEQRHGYIFADLDTLLAESDFVCLHMPLTMQTRRMIGAAQLARMKPTAYLINASRGGTVDEESLVDALKAGSIAGAGLDVFEEEPVNPENPLLQMENVVVTSHIGSASLASRRAMIKLAADNVIAFLQGNSPLNLVNPEILASKER